MQAGAIGIIGGADGPTAIFLSSKLAPNLMGAIAVSAYSYMALVPVIQPPIMRLLDHQTERLIRVKPPRCFSYGKSNVPDYRSVTYLFPCSVRFAFAVRYAVLPVTFEKSGVTRRLANTASGPLIDTITILLGRQ